MSDWKWLGASVFVVACILAAIWVGYTPWVWVQPASEVLAEPSPGQFFPGGTSCKAPSEEDRDRCIADAEAHRLTQNDLVQQTRAADAADLSSRMAVVQTKIAAISAVGGVLTLTAAAAAAYFARQGAMISMLALQASERPRLVVSSVSVGDLARPLEPEDNDKTEFETKIVNFGKDVAWIKRVGRSWQIIPGGQVPVSPELTFDEMHWPLLNGNWWGFDFKRGNGLNLSADQRDGICTGNFDLYSFLWVEYSSNDGSIYKSKAAYKYRAADGQMIPAIPSYWQHN